MPPPADGDPDCASAPANAAAEAALNRARQSYERRVEVTVRKEGDHWEAALKELGAGKESSLT